jgi:hypothetical protein
MSLLLTMKSLQQKINIKDLEHPRAVGRRAIELSVDPIVWQKNVEFSKDLQKMIDKHKLTRHPIIGLLNTEKLNKDVSKVLHFEFSYAFAEIFTDSLIHAMGTTASLEPRLGPLGKVSSRFLLQLNLLDELGYKPVTTHSGEDYAGNPLLAHYVQFHETLEQLGAQPLEHLKYQASKASIAARKTFTDHYESHLHLTAVLAVAETVFTLFAGPWAKSVSQSTDIDTSTGYHSIHVEDESGEFLDDDHSEDSWYIFRQVVEEKDYAEVREKVEQWLDIWYDFGDEQMHLARKLLKK